MASSHTEIERLRLGPPRGMHLDQHLAPLEHPEHAAGPGDPGEQFSDLRLEFGYADFVRTPRHAALQVVRFK
jgi:hypothetical protein